jgi:hypothetical protein
MGMDSSVIGLRDLDGQFEKMLKVKLACDEAGIEHPDDVYMYFQEQSELPEAGLRELLAEIDISAAVEELNEDSVDGFTVHLARLPAEVIAVQFRNSY